MTKNQKFEKIKNEQKIKNALKTKLGTISLFRNHLELVPKRREPQQRPLSLRCGTSSQNPILSSKMAKQDCDFLSQYWVSGDRFITR